MAMTAYPNRAIATPVNREASGYLRACPKCGRHINANGEGHGRGCEFMGFACPPFGLARYPGSWYRVRRP